MLIIHLRHLYYTIDNYERKKEPASIKELVQKKGKGGVSEKLISNFMLSYRIPAFKYGKPSFKTFFKKITEIFLCLEGRKVILVKHFKKALS
ncbi:hypothetical protein KYJ26_19635 [Bacillus sp. MCCB 382]|uniref:hypothetical protein n=1 Tax=Bacillus sp. MCCB 382 TaxID=2860197 RepID=UPI001C57E536|nr:hypothetical protein [Bacillus sp. MCCB 382]